MSGSASPESQSTPTDPPERARASLKRLVGFVLLGLFALYSLVGFLVVPRIVESQLVSILTERLGVTPKVGGVSFHPFRLRLAIEDFELPDPRGGPAVLALEELAIDAGLLGFLSASVSLDEFLLVSPRISIVVDESGTLNVSELLERFSSSAAPPSTPSPEEESGRADPLIVDVAVARIEGGDVVFHDRSQSPPFALRVAPFDLLVEGLTTRADVIAPYSLQLRVGEETELDWTGTLGLEPLRSEGRLELTGFDLTVPWDYLSERLRFEVTAGALEASADYRLDMSEGLSLIVSEGALETRDVEIVDPEAGGPTLSLPRLAVGGVEVSVGPSGLRTLAIADVALEGGHLRTHLAKDGQPRLLGLLQPVDQTPASKPAASRGQGDASAEPQSPKPDPELSVGRLALSDFEIELEDRGPATPAMLHASDLALEIRGFRNAPEAKLDVALRTRLGEAGRLAVSGPLVLSPLSTQLGVELRGLALSDFQPYLDGLANLDIVKGALSADLELDLREGGEASPRVSARGRLALDDLSTRDRRLEKKFVDWDRFAIEGLDFGPDRVRIEEIVLSGATTRLLLDASGRSNIASIFEQPDAADTPAARDSAAPRTPAKAGPAFSIEVARVTLDRVRAELVDQSIKPPFKLSLDDFGGTIVGLSSEKDARATVSLAGKVDDVAPLRIEGRVNPLSSDAYTDLELEMSGVSLPAFSPYSGRFVGYRIDRGKLGLDLHYALENRHLKAENLIKLQQFDFGQRVESAQATSLPVGLALTVMKDGAGNITLPLPIEGDLDDPSFDVLEVLGKTLVNLITRVATAPFSVVAGLVGSSAEDLSNVVFEPGRLEMAEGEEVGLRDVGTLLEKRPNLMLEIRGKADPDVDGPGLRRARIEESLRVRYFASVSRRQRERLGSPEAVVLDAKQRLEQLESLYRERIGGRLADRLPTGGETLSAEARALRLAEIAETALSEQIELEAEDWLELARARAARVQSTLVEADLVPAERIFLVDPEVGPSSTPGRVAVKLSLGVE